MRRVLVREEFCIGCGLCRVQCEAHHSGRSDEDLVKAFKKRVTPPTGGVRIEQSGSQCLSVRCQHCEDAQCVAACLTGALHRDEQSGLVLIDSERCIGCGTCMLVCPFGAISRDRETGKAVKCDGCLDRDVPRCVSACPNGALVVCDSPLSAAPTPATADRRPILV
jgi:carbon-monoxide dehydrogenase iron sulfur subunit